MRRAGTISLYPPQVVLLRPAGTRSAGACSRRAGREYTGRRRDPSARDPDAVWRSVTQTPTGEWSLVLSGYVDVELDAGTELFIECVKVCGAGVR